jgi:hypothetical protein
MGDILFIVSFLGFMLAPFIYYGIKGKKGMWFWVGTVSAMGICLGLGELASKMGTGATLSRNVWDLSLADPMSLVVVIGCMVVSWTLLMIHLAWKRITKK